MCLSCHHNSIEFKNKIKTTMLEKYGVENSSQNPIIQKKIQNTNVKKYGSISPFGNQTVQTKSKQTNLERYGVEYSAQNFEIYQKTKNTNLEKYGVENYSKTKEFVDKFHQTYTAHQHMWTDDTLTKYFLNHPEYFISKVERVNKSRWKFYDIEYGEWEAHISNVTSQQQLHPKRNKSIGGDILSHLLPGGIYYYNKNIPQSTTNYKPDYLSENPKLIIEADGLYWHSEKRAGNVLGNQHGQIDKTYHFNRFKEYANLGYDFLSFTNWEIENKPEIVQSLIYNKMNLINNKINAHRCALVKLNIQESNSFFENNHLISKGKSNDQTIALKYNNEIVCALRYTSQEKNIYISGFASKIFTVVTNGYSKLLEQLDQGNKNIIICVDCRYDTDIFFLNKGFVLIKEDIKFIWTDGKRVYNSNHTTHMEKYWNYGTRIYIKKSSNN